MNNVKQWGYAVLYINPKRYDYKDGIKSAIGSWFFKTKEEAEKSITLLDEDVIVLAIVPAPWIEINEESDYG